MPRAAKDIYGQIGLTADPADVDPADLKWGELAAGTRIGETVGVFPRIDKKKVMSEIEETAGSGQGSVASEETEKKAAAVEEQSAVTSEMSTSMQRAAAEASVIGQVA